VVACPVDAGGRRVGEVGDARDDLGGIVCAGAVDTRVTRVIRVGVIGLKTDLMKQDNRKGSRSVAALSFDFFVLFFVSCCVSSP
jgi:hypothetical protein